MTTAAPHYWPILSIHLNDVFAGIQKPLEDIDPDAVIAVLLTDLEARLKATLDTGIVFPPDKPTLLPIRGREGICPTILDQIESGLQNIQALLWEHGAYAGIVSNHAGRIKEGQEEEEDCFYLAVTTAGTRIAVTPLSDLWTIKEEVATLYRVPNDSRLYNGVKNHQYRSSCVSKLLYGPLENVIEDYDLVDCSTDLIPEVRGTLLYSDSFGNVIARGAYTPALRRKLSDAIAKANGNGVRVRVTVNGKHIDCTVRLDLATVPPGENAAYSNGNGLSEDLDIVWKWTPESTAAEQQENSAYAQLGKPTEGLCDITIEILEEETLAAHSASHNGHA